MNFELLTQLIINGLVVGTLYGVVAMCFVLIYKSTRVVNFAQGEFLLIGAWTCWAMLVKFARGSMFGEPGNVKRQRRIIMDALDALQTMTEPGTIQELPYRWKKPDPE